MTTLIMVFIQVVDNCNSAVIPQTIVSMNPLNAEHSAVALIYNGIRNELRVSCFLYRISFDAHLGILFEACYNLAVYFMSVIR